MMYRYLVPDISDRERPLGPVAGDESAVLGVRGLVGVPAEGDDLKQMESK